jgi:hypothetical protein
MSDRAPWVSPAPSSGGLVGDDHRTRYRLLGHEAIPLTFFQLEEMVRQGILTVETKVRRDGESFGAAIGARHEFQHLLTQTETEPVHPPGR